jgi:hypothetical protein
MAIVTNTATTYTGATIREDLSDVIYNIAPMDTPFLSGCGKGKAEATLFEWQIDTIAAGSANRQLEGDDSPAVSVATSSQQPTKLTNYTQISRAVNMTSGTDEAVNYAGRGKAQAYQLAKAGKRMKRDMEFMLTNNIVKAVGSTSGARATAGLPSWLSTGHVAGGASGSPTAGSLGTTAMVNNTNTAAATEANIKSVIKKCFDAGGQPDMILVPSTVKQTISGLASVGSGSTSLGVPPRHSVSGSGPATAVAAVDVYVSDFGTFKIVPDRNLATDGPSSVAANAFFLDMDFWAINWLRPWHTETMAKTGDSIKQMLIAEYGLVSRNEKSSGILASVS